MIPNSVHFRLVSDLLPLVNSLPGISLGNVGLEVALTNSRGDPHYICIAFCSI